MKKFTIQFFVCAALLSNHIFTTPRKLAAPTHDERQALYAEIFKHKLQEEIYFDVTPLRCIALLLLAGSGHCAATILGEKQQVVMDEIPGEQCIALYKNDKIHTASRFDSYQKQKSKISNNPRHR